MRTRAFVLSPLPRLSPNVNKLISPRRSIGNMCRRLTTTALCSGGSRKLQIGGVVGATLPVRTNLPLASQCNSKTTTFCLGAIIMSIIICLPSRRLSRRPSRQKWLLIRKWFSKHRLSRLLCKLPIRSAIIIIGVADRVQFHFLLQWGQSQQHQYHLQKHGQLLQLQQCVSGHVVRSFGTVCPKSTTLLIGFNRNIIIASRAMKGATFARRSALRLVRPSARTPPM